MADYSTFLNLIDECQRALKQYAGAKEDLVKNMINMVYLNEMVTVDSKFPLHWLVDFDDTLASKAPSVINALTAADPGVFTTTAAHGLVVGDVVSIYSILGTTTLNNRMYKVNSIPSTTTLSVIDIDGLDAIDTTSLTAYSSAGVINHRGLTLATTGKNVEKIVRCAWQDQEPMTKITEDQLEATTQWWDSSTELPRHYYHRKKYTTTGTETNYLLWFNAADAAYDLRYWIEIRPPKLANDGDVPLLPPKFHYGIVAGVLTRLAEQNVQVENKSIWPQIYTAQLEQLKEANRKWYSKNTHYFTL